VNCIKYEDSPRVPRRQGGTVTANVLPVEKKKKGKKEEKKRSAVLSARCDYYGEESRRDITVIRQILMCPDDDASAIKNFMLKNDRPYALVSRSITRGNRKFPVAMFPRAYARQRRVCERINLSEREIIQKGKHRFEHYSTQGKTEEPARTLFLVKAPSLKTRWKEKEMKRDGTFGDTARTEMRVAYRRAASGTRATDRTD